MLSSLSSIELLLWVGLLSLLPLLLIVLRGTMGRVRQRDDAARAACNRTGRKQPPRQPHLAKVQTRSRQTTHRDRAA